MATMTVDPRTAKAHSVALHCVATVLGVVLLLGASCIWIPARPTFFEDQFPGPEHSPRWVSLHLVAEGVEQVQSGTWTYEPHWPLWIGQVVLGLLLSGVLVAVLVRRGGRALKHDLPG